MRRILSLLNIRAAHCRSYSSFPSQPSQLTGTWLAEVLTASGRIAPGSTVSSFEGTPLGAGVGLASVVQRLRISVVPPGGAPPEHVDAIAKFLPIDPSAREMALRLGSFRRECGFYAALREGVACGLQPLAAPSAAPASPDAAAAALPAPSLFFARHDDAAGSACLLLEDLGGYTAGDQVAGASAQLARAVVLDSARLHAAFWGHPRLPRLPESPGGGASPKSLRETGAGRDGEMGGPGWASWLPALNSKEFLAFDVAGFNAALPRWRARFPDAYGSLPGDVREILDRGGFPAAAARLLRRLGGDARERPSTLLHGDLRLDNVLWRSRAPAHRGGARDGSDGREGSGARADGREGLGIDARYIDLGDCAAGRGAFDVGYFLAMSVDPAVRSQIEQPLLAEYADAVRSGLAVRGRAEARERSQARSRGSAGAGASSAGGSPQLDGADWDGPDRHGERYARIEREVRDDYKAAVGYAICLAVNLGGSEGLDEAAPRKMKLAAAMAERAAAALGGADGAAGAVVEAYRGTGLFSDDRYS